MWTSNPVLSIMTGRMETDGDPWLFAQQLENRFGSGMSGITRFCSPAGTSMIAFPGSMVNELETVCARPFPCLRHPRHIRSYFKIRFTHQIMNAIRQKALYICKY